MRARATGHNPRRPLFFGGGVLGLDKAEMTLYSQPNQGFRVETTGDYKECAA